MSRTSAEPNRANTVADPHSANTVADPHSANTVAEPHSARTVQEPINARNLRRPLALAAVLIVALAGCSSIDKGAPTPTASDTRSARAGGALRVALSAEPDALDPTLARTLVGRTVFTAICEKLYDVDSKLTVVPQLAAALPEFSADGLTVTIKVRPGVKFADGTTLDAAAVKTSLDRHMTMNGSARKSELTSVGPSRSPTRARSASS